MRAILVIVVLGFAITSARAQSVCDLRSAFKGSNEPAVVKILGRLKGAVAMHGVGACSGALVTFKGRGKATRALVLSAGHCANRGSVQIPLGQRSIAMLDMGEVLYRAEYRRTLTLETGNSEEPRTCAEADQVVYETLTGADVLLLRLTETYEEIERRDESFAHEFVIGGRALHSKPAQGLDQTPEAKAFAFCLAAHLGGQHSAHFVRAAVRA
jgi:hypothetical protein